MAAGGVPGAAWKRLKDRADEHLLKVQPEVVRANVGAPVAAQGLEKRYTLQNEMPTYLIDLGMAYQLSGDVRYGRRVIDLLLALGDAHWPYWAPQDLGVGDLLEGVGLGFDWTYQLMTPTERRTIVGAITRDDKLLLDRLLVHPTHPASRYPRSNWMGVTAGGAGLTALAILGEPGAPAQTEDYLRRAMALTDTFFRAAVDKNGAYNEGHTYGYYGMKNSVPFALAVKRAGRGDLIAGTGLPQLARWQAFEQLPGEGQNFVPLNDSGRAQFGAGLASLHFAIAPHNGVAQWLWQRTVGPLGDDLYGASAHAPAYGLPNECTQPRYNPEPVALAACPIANLHDNVFAILFYRPPRETPETDPSRAGLSVWHASRGLVDARTGFRDAGGEAVSTFEAHRDGTGHFQYDVGNFTLYGEGGRFAVDPGTSCVACGNTDDMGYAIDHNVVLVDGTDPSFGTREITYQQAAYDDPGARVVTTTTAPNQHFDQLTVLALTAAGQPVATTFKLAVKGGNAIAVDWKGGRDVIVRRFHLSGQVTGPVATDGTMAKYTRGTGDTVLSGGTRLIGQGVIYVAVTGQAADVVVSGATITARGPVGNSYRVLAPQRITSLRVNGVSVRACREGGYLSFPCR